MQKLKDISDYIKIYSEMTPEQLDREILDIYDMCYAILEVTDCYSLESYPTPNIRIKIALEFLNDANSKEKMI